MKIGQKAFKTWLSVNTRRHFRPRSACRCPIAAYLKAKGAETPTVGIDTYHLERAPYDRDFPLPSWAQRFVSAVDSRGGDRIGGRRALEILKQVDLA